MDNKLTTTESAETKRKWTPEERLELQQKLEKDLENYIESLPKRETPKEQQPMTEEWVDDLLSHPFFMKKIPEPGDPVHPLFEGLQQLKYDPNENTKEDLALSYKEDGNFNYKHRNYRLAILAYTEGLKVKCDNDELNAILYNNRAAANYFLNNYRSCIQDIKQALKLKPDYDKTKMRLATCYFHLEKYSEAIEVCEEMMEKDKYNSKEFQNLRKKCIVAEKNKKWDARKKEIESKKKEKELIFILEEVRKRGIAIEGGNLSLEKLEPCFPQLVNERVFVTEQSELVWPVVFMYPEFQIMDFVQKFNENEVFASHLDLLFEEPAEWDRTHAYKTSTVNIYFENEAKSGVIKVDQNKTLGETIKDKRFILRGGTPSFIIVVKGSAVEKRLLDSYH